MTPNVSLTTTAVGNLNEDLITITFDVSKSAQPGAVGEIALFLQRNLHQLGHDADGYYVLRRPAL